MAGAGRGPLVARCFKALERSRRDATVIAVEKNPNAFVTYVLYIVFYILNGSVTFLIHIEPRLQQRQATEWDNKVKLCFGDMRVIDVPEKADILVSELLGSFGDNELSPECLDGAMRFLKRKSTSYLAHIFYGSLTALLWLRSKWYIYPLIVHGPSCTSVIFQAI